MKIARFVGRHWFLSLVVTLVVCCVVFGPQQTGQTLRHGGIAVWSAVGPLVGDAIWGAWALAHSVVGAG